MSPIKMVLMHSGDLLKEIDDIHIYCIICQVRNMIVDVMKDCHID
jgi:hypothetical protein